MIPGPFKYTNSCFLFLLLQSHLRKQREYIPHLTLVLLTSIYPCRCRHKLLQLMSLINEQQLSNAHAF